MNNLELSWAAGLFDGEGTTCVTKSLYKSSIYKRFVVELAQSGNKIVLLRLKKALNNIGNIYGPYQRKNYLPQYVYRVEGVKGLVVMNLLSPYLSSIKKNQFKKALSTFRGN